MISALSSYLKYPGFDSIPRVFTIFSVARKDMPVETLTIAHVHFFPRPSPIHTKFFRRGMNENLSNFAKSTRKHFTTFHAFLK
jgi:hypothetical protein